MANVGKFFKKHFQDKEIEFYSGIDREWITYADSTTINGTLMHMIFKEYDEDSGVMTFVTLDHEHEIYISEDAIEMFWKSGFSLLQHSKTIMNTSQKLFNQKNRDIM